MPCASMLLQKAWVNTMLCSTAASSPHAGCLSSMEYGHILAQDRESNRRFAIVWTRVLHGPTNGPQSFKPVAGFLIILRLAGKRRSEMTNPIGRICLQLA